MFTCLLYNIASDIDLFLGDPITEKAIDNFFEFYNIEPIFKNE